MSRSILREPGAVQPWEPGTRLRVTLRPAAPKSGSSVLADLTGAVEPGPSEMLSSGSVPCAAEEADRLRAAAVREGYADGQVQALEERAEERQRLRELLAGMGEAYRSFCLRQVPELAALAAAAAEKLLYEQLTLEPERVLVIVQQAIEQVVGTGPITIHLNPEDVALVRGHLVRDEGRGTRDEKRELTPDPAVEPGGCWIESDHGEVDATISGRLSRVKELLTRVEG